MSEAASEFVKRLKQEVDELLLQANLGKAEALDFVEEHKGKFNEVLDLATAKLVEAPEDGEKSSQLNQKIDELKLQLALGKMESRDAYEEQRTKLESSVQNVKEVWDPLEDELKGLIETGAEALMTKLDAAALNLDLGSLVVEEEAKIQKDKIQTELKDLQRQIEPALEETKDTVETVGAELATAFTDIKDKLRQLLN